ncbi:MAG TPA: hypothetical protein DDY91_20570 [Planctomycetaceae bacterium]|nr:hypothetical protein [Planctomycetaceae bacterium]
MLHNRENSVEIPPGSCFLGGGLSRPADFPQDRLALPENRPRMHRPQSSGRSSHWFDNSCALQRPITNQVQI